jgi:peptidase E
VTDSWAGRLALLPCLGFLPGTGCPHYDGEAERRPALHRMLKRPSLPAALALDDGTAAHFVGRRLLRVVASRPTAFAYHVRSEGARAVETVLPVVRLPRYPT